MRIGATGLAKISKNLSLDEAAVVRGKRFSKKYETSLSQLVSDFLAHLPVAAAVAAAATTLFRWLSPTSQSTAEAVLLPHAIDHQEPEYAVR